MGFRFRRAAVAGIALLASLFPSSTSRSYDAGSMEDPNMHPVITSEAVRAHNQTAPSLELRIDEDSKSRMLEGSINEDDFFPRYLHHFNPGIWGFSSADVWATSPEEQTGPIVAAERVPEEAQSFYGGLLNQCQCLNYVGGDQSWQQAVEELRIRGKPSNALGHILHLIEDMTMPAHVRSDVHILRAISVEIDSEGFGLSRIGDFHEYMTSFHLEWMDGVQTYNVGEFNSIEDLFDDVASFTRNHFYSDDTLPSNDELASKYDMERVGRKTYFVDEIDGNKVFVARKGWLGPVIDERCSESMAAVLLPRAVGYAQATIKLAYKEAGLWPNTGCNTLAAECVGNSVEQYDDCGNLIRKEDCGPNQYCDNARCIDNVVCQPDCSGKECGDDGCGNNCGDCSGEENCVDNLCVPSQVCNNRCSDPGASRCFENGYGYEVCSRRSGSDCIRWVPIHCSTGDYCEEGECVIPPNRWVDLGDGTVKDYVARLTWEKVYGGAYSFDRALNYCEELSLAGYTNWSLPGLDTLMELQLETASDNGCFIDPVFEGPCGLYWSSNYGSVMAWTIDFEQDHGWQVTVNKNDSTYVRCVRRDE